jgi:hypothetical protein
MLAERLGELFEFDAAHGRVSLLDGAEGEAAHELFLAEPA